MREDRRCRQRRPRKDSPGGQLRSALNPVGDAGTNRLAGRVPLQQRHDFPSRHEAVRIAAVLAFTPFTLPYGAYGIGFLFFGWGMLVAFAVWGAPWMYRTCGPIHSFAIALGVFTAILVALAMSIDNHVAVTALVIACGAPLGILNTLFTETAMNVSPVPRPVGYNFVRFLGAVCHRSSAASSARTSVSAHRLPSVRPACWPASRC